MKKIVTVVMLLLSFISLAQGGRLLREKKEQIKAMKVAYITNELALTPDEAAKFWPLYNAFEEKQHEIRKQKLKGYLDRVDDESFDNVSDKEAATLLAQMESTEDELYQAKKKFIASLKGVISPLKILKLKKAEEGFNRKLLQQYRDRKFGR
ncbi:MULTISPECIES: sensor of ECF-type sigma factor [Flavobacterium]|uniref:Sensor of ECF-type sigma factor n=1 Tax=Flavobacterium sedimenticola TaxID=3043286 RepID=A0ABT6XSP5_9FLAO|nr:sensor of ECF-type sigma factor [Flavobacterium sedimenticola]MDI9258118.1 sensor of ECF-type sigma factor [Flavobacterium sedimenticola]